MEAQTGEMHLDPEPYLVVFEHESFKVGDFFFSLDGQGEGIWYAWHKGEIKSVDLAGAQNGEDRCLVPSSECWLQLLKDEMIPSHDKWWIRIKTSSGKVGWTSRDDLLDILDNGCE